jgi:hypothetical protein
MLMGQWDDGMMDVDGKKRSRVPKADGFEAWQGLAGMNPFIASPRSALRSKVFRSGYIQAMRRIYSYGREGRRKLRLLARLVSGICRLYLLVPALDERQRFDLSNVRLEGREIVVAHLGVLDGSKPAVQGEVGDAMTGRNKNRGERMSASSQGYKQWRHEGRVGRDVRDPIESDVLRSFGLLLLEPAFEDTVGLVLRL